MDDTDTNWYDPTQVFYTTADTDTDTSTPCIGLENATYMQWVARSIQG